MLVLDGILTFAFLAMVLVVIISAFKHKKLKKKILATIGTFLALGISCTLTPDSQLQTMNTNTAVTTQNQQTVNKNNDKNGIKPNNNKAQQVATTDPNLGQLKIHYIDVGQGDSILVEQDKHFMLIDAGTNECEGLIVDYLKRQGVTKLDYAIGTHPHEDHIGGMDKVIDNFDIGTLLMPKKIANTKTFKDVLLSAKSKGLKITQPVVGTNYNLGKAIFTILAPKDHDYESTNNYSIVQKLKFGNTSFIFTGDAEAISEMEMVNANLDLQADVLKVGHHGSKTSTCQAFLDKVNPKYAVISCGKDNKYKHPNKSTMDRISMKGITVYRTDECGNAIAISDGKNITFNCKEGSYSYRDIETNNTNNANGSKTSGISTTTGAVTPVQKPTPNVNPNKSHSNGSVVNNTSISEQGKVYYTPNGKCYHSSTGCPTLKRSKKIITGTANNCGGRRPCSKCN